MSMTKRLLEEAEQVQLASEHFSATLETFESELDNIPNFTRHSEMDEFFGSAYALLGQLKRMIDEAQYEATEAYRR